MLPTRVVSCIASLVVQMHSAVTLVSPRHTRCDRVRDLSKAKTTGLVRGITSMLQLALRLRAGQYLPLVRHRVKLRLDNHCGVLCRRMRREHLETNFEECSHNGEG
ncbi:hypothetical protein IF1G_06146 [Cordyceps javanica]|uniref:Uncharacterized protein n=1 Tax=Cordyceps javanica TaxID=43265 RepID=A0A545V0E3_9HYPO|nr:hypothetical protein IF1G_06146 [Cordyceps javanica]